MKKDPGFAYKITKGKPWPRGIIKQDGYVNICVEVREAKSCSLLLYHPGEKEACHRLEFEESDRFGSLYCAALAGFPVEEYEYTFLVGERELVDPCALRICGRMNYSQPPEYVRGRYPEQLYDWEEDVPPRIPYEEGILYTAHVRGLTMDPSAKAKYRGTFAGVRERIPYLMELGINMLELMPAYEFDERIPREVSSMAYFMNSGNPGDHYKLNYWGYGEGYYFAPKQSYAYSDCPEREFKDMVKALHRAGMELIMEFYFPEGTYPGLILDCLKYWVLQYHVDGFHLSGCGIPMPWIAREPMLSDIKLMGNDFRADEVYKGKYPKYRNLAEYHDGSLVDMRRFLRGDDNQTGSFAYRARYNPGGSGVINYIASHNGFTLYDMVTYEQKHNEENGEDNRDGSDWNYSCNYGEEGKSRKKSINQLRRRQIKNALLMVFLSQGTPCILAGDECLNSQEGNNNAWCLDSPVSWVNYNGGKNARELREFVRQLIEFRKAHPVFHQRRELQGTDYSSFGYPDISYHGENAWYPGMEGSSRQLGIMYGGKYADDACFYVAYNMHPEAKEFALPRLPKGMRWYKKMDTSMEGTGILQEGEEIRLNEQKSIKLSGRTTFVLEGRQED